MGKMQHMINFSFFFLLNSVSTFCGFFKAKIILVEEQ